MSTALAASLLAVSGLHAPKLLPCTTTVPVFTPARRPLRECLMAEGERTRLGWVRNATAPTLRWLQRATSKWSFPKVGAGTAAGVGDAPSRDVGAASVSPGSGAQPSSGPGQDVGKRSSSNIERSSRVDGVTRAAGAAARDASSIDGHESDAVEDGPGSLDRGSEKAEPSQGGDEAKRGARGAALAGGAVLATLGAAGAVRTVRNLRPRPVLLVHGILDCAENMQSAADYLRAALGPGSYVRAVNVGNGYVDSLTRPMNWQLASLTATIRADPKLADGFNMIGYSQGSLLARGYVQRHNSPPVFTLISWVGPQAGQFGVPAWEELFAYLNKITSPMWYSPPIQSTVSFSNYWRDPMHLSLYHRHSAFLADLNNEREVKNRTYAANLASLECFVLIASTVDMIIVPRESSWFATYAPNSTTITPMRSSPLYLEDWIGLRELDRSGRLHFASCICHHREVPTSACKLQVWDRVSLRFLQPRGALPTLMRWLLPEPGPEAVRKAESPADATGDRHADGKSVAPTDLVRIITGRISNATRAASRESEVEWEVPDTEAQTKHVLPFLRRHIGRTFPREAPRPGREQ